MRQPHLRLPVARIKPPPQAQHGASANRDVRLAELRKTHEPHAGRRDEGKALRALILARKTAGLENEKVRRRPKISHAPHAPVLEGPQPALRLARLGLECEQL